MPEITPKDPTLKTLKGLHLWHAPMSSCSQRVRIALAETDQSFESHLIDLEKDEHATPAYQAIHPKGLVPALVRDGHLFIESVDIIAEVASGLAAGSDLLALADAAQLDLKLLTFEFLFRAGPPASDAATDAFAASHQNDWLVQFRQDVRDGFSPARVNAAVARTDAGFATLEDRLSDGRTWLEGEDFSLSDVAWMPNVHRFSLMDWPFHRYPALQRWFDRVRTRPSYHSALMDWQPEPVPGVFAAYTEQRRAEGTDVTSVAHFRDPKAAV